MLPITESSPYTNWILDFHRKNNTRKFNTSVLVNNYLNSEKLSFNNNNDDAQEFYTLLQFYFYLRIKEFKILDSIILNLFNDHRIFYKIEFHLQDFLRFIEQESYYQLKNKQKILDSFFKNLSDAKLKTFMSSYQEQHFKSLAIFPGYGITKKNKYITVQLYIAKDFYHYNYPFHFNQFFITYRNQYECIVKLRIIQSFSQQSLIKEFNLNDLLDQHKRSASQVRQIKQIVVECFNIMKQDQMIEPRIMVVIKDHAKHYQVKKQFTLDMFLKADRIIFTERLVC